MNNIFIITCERIKKQKWYIVDFPYNIQMIDRIKNLPIKERKFNSNSRVWTITVEGIYSLMQSYKGSKKLKFEFVGVENARDIFIEQVREVIKKKKEIQEKLNTLNKKKEYWLKFKKELEEIYIHDSQRVHRNLKPNIKLFPHQVIAVLFLEKVRSALLAHEMGLGKTVESITYVELQNFNKVFVITPNSLKFNYYDEVEKFTNSKAHIIGWKKNIYSIEESKYIITNYDYFNPSLKDEKRRAKMDEKFKALNLGKIDCMVLDECQKINNTKSNTYLNIKRLFKKDIFVNKQESRIYMSGTPIGNRSEEMFSVLNSISPLEFPTKEFFYEYYCGMTYNHSPEEGEYQGWKKDFTKTKLEELYNKIAPYVHRKRKQEVLKDLPEITYQKVLLELDHKQEKVYTAIEKNIVGEFLEEKITNPLAKMVKLRQFTSEAKLSAVCDLIDSLLYQGEKVVIIDEFKSVLNKLKEKYGDKAALHTGDVSIEERKDIIKDFQSEDGQYKIFLASIQTANYGLTLTAASNMIIITLPYSVSKYDQVSSRCHRISQKNAVNLYVIIFEYTIDELVYSTIESKRYEIDQVIDGKQNTMEIEESVVSDVISAIKNKYSS